MTNPWGRGEVTLYRNGRKAEELSGDTLVLSTSKGESVVVVPKGSLPATVKM